MFYELFHIFGEKLLFLNIFKYITFRSFGAILTSFLIGLFLGPFVIRTLKKFQTDGQPIRIDGPENHLLTKKGTPTMGGVLIILSILGSALLWCDLHNPFIWIVLFILTAYGIIGGIDDYLKLLHKNSKGISGKTKLFFQILFASLVFYWAQKIHGYNSTLNIPFLKNWIFDLGAFYAIFGVFVIIGASNAVNLTDGLDGLAIVPVMITSACLGLIAYLTGHLFFAKYLYIPSIPGTGELTIICSAMVGAGLGFLWYNTPPAHVFMGDIGSLAIGGSLGTISVLTKHEFALAIIGGVFVLETVSVMIQVCYFKITKGKRIFLMTPIHHHFEKKGWSEATIVIRFWIISVVFALLGLATLKLR